MVEVIEDERGRGGGSGMAVGTRGRVDEADTLAVREAFRLSPGFRYAVSVGSPIHMKYPAMTSALFVSAAAAAVAFAPSALADPAPPPCVNADGSACADLGTAGPGGASGAIPGGPGGAAGPGGATGSIPGGPEGTAGPGGATGSIPFGPSGSAGPGGAAGCIPNVGCATVPVG